MKLYVDAEEFIKAEEVEKKAGEGKEGEGVLIRVEDWTEALEVIKKIQDKISLSLA